MDEHERLRQLDAYLDRSCAASGVTVEITDPVALARIAALIRGAAAPSTAVGKRTSSTTSRAPAAVDS